jgi:hypothetical protein
VSEGFAKVHFDGRKTGGKGVGQKQNEDDILGI